MSSKKSHFIVFIHTQKPAQGARTEMPNFAEEGKWNVQEMVYFVDKIKSHHMDTATVIIDYDNWKVVKDRTDSVTGPQQMLDHVQKHYPQQYIQFIDIVKDVTPKK